VDEEFDAKVEDITGLYMTAIERHLQGERTISIDEMTGIQATERLEKTCQCDLVKLKEESLSIFVTVHKA
jgi:hypothetical protein